MSKNQDAFKSLEAALKEFGLNEIPEELKQLLNNKKTSDPISEKEYIYSTLKSEAKFLYSKELDACVRTTVDRLLEKSPKAQEPGLLLGKIQCGKTNAFVNIMALAFDQGVDICIVLTKGVNSLATQTKERMAEDFKIFEESASMQQRATIYIHDILDIYRNGIAEAKFRNRNNVKFVLVCKKEGANIRHLTELFTEKSPHLLERKVLVIDDEADFTSRTYVKKKGKVTLATISQQINDFVGLPKDCRYLQVTATPYSLFLQPSGEIVLGDGGKATPWRPRFTTLVPIHSRYIGGDQYFVESQDPESMYSHLFRPVSSKCISVLGTRYERYMRSSLKSSNIQGLSYAVIAYLMGTAIRCIQMAKEGNHYSSSALFHNDIAKDAHEWQSDLIHAIVEDIEIGLRSQDDLRIEGMIKDSYEDMKESHRKAKAAGQIKVHFPSLKETRQRMVKIFDDGDYKIHVVNSSNDVPNMLDKNGQLRLDTAANFFIGGSILDRGITIGQMLCFFYGRDPKRFQMDTVLQHARMFGARALEDMAVTRFHTTHEIYKVLSHMNEIDNQLREVLLSRNDESGDAEMDALFVGYDKVIKPCSTQKIRVSETRVLKSHMRLSPHGFQIGYKTNIGKIVSEIDQILAQARKNDKSKGEFFRLPLSDALHIMTLIRKTHLYDKNYDNVELEWKEDEMKGAMQYACEQAGTDFVYCLHKEDRNLSRYQSNNVFSDKPESGQEMSLAREVAISDSVLMLFRENGDKDLGWNGAPFYWPVFVMPREIAPAIFTYGSKKTDLAEQVESISIDSILKGIPKEDVLSLTINSEFFWEIYSGEKTEETRDILETTASRYLVADEKNKFGYAYRKDINIPKGGVDAGIYSHVKEEFPFEINVRPYLLLRNSRDSSGSLLLLQLDKKKPYYLESEDLSDSDILISPTLQKQEHIDDLRQWILNFRISKVVRASLNKRDKKIAKEMKAQEEK